MSHKTFQIITAAIALIFTLFFSATIIPALIKNPDVIGAFAAGFVNPYASGYSFDVICCWLILAVWVIYESPMVKYGWVWVLLGIVPGVAVGFAGYLIMRQIQIEKEQGREISSKEFLEMFDPKSSKSRKS